MSHGMIRSENAENFFFVVFFIYFLSARRDAIYKFLRKFDYDWQETESSTSRLHLRRFLFFKIKGDIECALVAVKGVGITDVVAIIFIGGNLH